MWYKINNVNELDSPSLLIYKERVQNNIEQMISIAGSAEEKEQVRSVIGTLKTKFPAQTKFLDEASARVG
jgi:D-serine deaminase-like pyridoxal phosphate-dependent protein